MGRQSGDRPPGEMDAVGRRRQNAGDAAQQRRLAGAVGADDRHRPTLLDFEIDIEKNLEIPIEGR
jgi:hypothetical protein